MRKVLILLEDLVEDTEFIYPYLRLKEEGFYVISCGPEKREYRGKKGMSFKADKTLEEVSKDEFDCVFIPGGYAPDRLRRNPLVLNLVRRHYESNKLVCAVCHGPWVLISAKIVKGKRVTGFHAIKDDIENAGAVYTANPVEIDGNLITATDPITMLEMMKELIKKLSS